MPSTPEPVASAQRWYHWFPVLLRCISAPQALRPAALVQLVDDCWTLLELPDGTSRRPLYLPRGIEEPETCYLNGGIGGDLLDRLAATDHLHGDPGLEFGTVAAAPAHGWEPRSAAVPRLRE
jgi:hypothetical protein